MTTAAAESPSSVVNEQNPWPGLAPFDEAAAPFFNGRERETAEFFRLVTGSHLAVLFGASGLGKSSLLQAGLFPRLRRANYLPVYLRLDVSDTSRPLMDQVRDTLIRELQAHGVDAPEFEGGESLWRYLHRDGLEFWSPQTQLMTPLFVFDQFEEILTFRDENPAGALQFQTDLADLAENRIPAALAASALAGLALDHSGYKIVLSFREDYTAAFETWKRDLPSIMRNRYPLLAMDSTNALEAVLSSGAAVIEPVVAQEIVRYVAGADDKTDEEILGSYLVEPALLSVVCHELNRKRLAATPPAAKITSADFKASRENILNDFYERSLAGTPKQVRQFIEERLLTESGRRNTAPEDDAQRAGVPLAVVDQLVDRRLLRRERRLGVAHLELTHDRLTTVVAISRDARRVRDRRWRLVLFFSVTALVLAAILGLFAYREVANVRAAQQQALAMQKQEFAYKAIQQAEVHAKQTENLNEELAKAVKQSEADAALARAALSAAQLRSNFRFGLTQVIASASADVVLTIGEDGTLNVLHGYVDSGKSYFITDPAGPIIAAAISPSEKQIATATASGHIAGWDVSSRRRIFEFEWDGQISSLSFYSENAGKLIVASRDGSLHLFDTRTGRLEKSGNAVFLHRGCIPFSVEFLAYTPRPEYKATVGFEAKCVGDLQDSSQISADGDSVHGLSPDQVAHLAGPATRAAIPNPSISDAPKISTAKTTPDVSVQTENRHEIWYLHFSVWIRKKPEDAFGDPIEHVDLEFSGGPRSLDIVNRGLDEAQIRAVSRDIEQLVEQLRPSDAIEIKENPSRQSELLALVHHTAGAILKGLGFPPI
jgi:hypothetical protein